MPKASCKKNSSMTRKPILDSTEDLVVVVAASLSSESAANMMNLGKLLRILLPNIMTATK
eukprot:948073-Amphidinium_carterae.1